MKTLTPFQAAAAGLDTLPDKWLTPEAAAKLLSVSLRTLIRLEERGQIPPPVRFSRKLTRFDRKALIECLHQGGFPRQPREAKPDSRKAKAVPAVTPEAPGPMEPLTPCEDCGRPLWAMQLQNGKVDVYCPNCIRVSLGEAS